MTITIKNLTINVTLAGAANPLAALLSGLSSVEVRRYETDEAKPATGDANTASEAQSEAVVASPVIPTLTGDNVVAFLNSDPRFKLRTVDSIAKHFDVAADNADLEDVLDDLVADELVYTKTRRSDSATLYGAN